MTAPTSPPAQGFLQRHALKLVASVVITAAMVFAVTSGGLELVPEGGDFSGVNYWALALYMPFVLALMWFRSVRWRFLLRATVDVPKRRLLSVTCAGYMAILLLPFRLGELVRPYLLRTPPEKRSEGAPAITMTSATGSVVAERVIDGLFLSIVLAIVLLLVPTVDPLPDKVVGLPISVAQVRLMGFAMLGVFASAFAVILTFYFARRWAERLTRAIIGKVSMRVADLVAGTAIKLADGLHVFRSGRDLFGFVVETAAYWALNAVGMWVLAVGCGVVHGDGSSITLWESWGLLGMLGCTILIPGPPGLLGVFQAGIYAGMTMYFPTEIVTGPGAAFVFLLYSSQVVLTIAAGIWGFWEEGGTRRLRDALHANAVAEPTSTAIAQPAPTAE